jgi:PAS domain S-box-containing protein
LDTGSDDEIGQISKAFDGIAEDLMKANADLDNLSRKNTGYEATHRELRSREEYFRRLFLNSNDAVFIYDFEGKIIGVNNKACTMLDHTKEQLQKMSFFELHTEEELTKSKSAYKTGRDTSSVKFESKFKKQDGTLVDVEINSSVVDLKKGIMQSIVSNIHERKKMEEALKLSEEKFRTFIETASDLMFITDKDGLFTYVNQSMFSILGYTKQEMIGMHISEILDKESLEDSKKKRVRLLTEGENIHKLIWERKDRRKIYGEMKATGIYDNDGQFRGVRGVFRDITERKKIEASQRLTQLGKLSADVVHEVKNQLTVISGMAQLTLMDVQNSPKLEKNLKTITDQCDQVNDVIKRLLMFSKPSSKDFKRVDINHTINFITDLLEKQYLIGRVVIIKEFSPKLPRVKADEKQIQEVFMNLLQNAFEAISGDGTITISTSQKDGYVQIDFNDTGRGIAENDMEKLFDPFFTTKENGTGLGLSACYGIIKAHNGDIRYSSKLGDGTTATVLLPISGQNRMRERLAK